MLQKILIDRHSVEVRSYGILSYLKDFGERFAVPGRFSTGFTTEVIIIFTSLGKNGDRIANDAVAAK